MSIRNSQTSAYLPNENKSLKLIQVNPITGQKKVVTTKRGQNNRRSLTDISYRDAKPSKDAPEKLWKKAMASPTSSFRLQTNAADRADMQSISNIIYEGEGNGNRAKIRKNAKNERSVPTEIESAVRFVDQSVRFRRNIWKAECETKPEHRVGYYEKPKTSIDLKYTVKSPTKSRQSISSYKTPSSNLVTARSSQSSRNTPRMPTARRPSAVSVLTTRKLSNKPMTMTTHVYDTPDNNHIFEALHSQPQSARVRRSTFSDVLTLHTRGSIGMANAMDKHQRVAYSARRPRAKRQKNASKLLDDDYQLEQIRHFHAWLQAKKEKSS